MIHRITLDMALARGLDYYTGVIYEAVLLRSKIECDPKVASISASAERVDSKGAAADVSAERVDFKDAAADASAKRFDSKIAVASASPEKVHSKSATAIGSAERLESEIPAPHASAEWVNLGSIAAGGRYDGLVGMFSGKSVPAVGVSIGIERIFNLLEKRKGTTRKNHTQVLLCSVGKDMLKHKLALATTLWQAGIAAEFEYHAAPSPKDQGARADREMIPITVWIGADEVKRGVVTVKDMRAQYQYSEAQHGKNHGVAVGVENLIAHIKQMLISPTSA
jgi:histidyl-tRNA synthetase